MTDGITDRIKRIKMKRMPDLFSSIRAVLP